MRIRPEQFQALDDAARADLYERLAAYLRRKLPDLIEGSTDAVLLERIAASARKAGAYGVTTDVAVAEFICLSFVAGENFDELPQVQMYLTHPGLHPNDKVRMLANQLVSFLHDYKAGQDAPTAEKSADRR